MEVGLSLGNKCVAQVTAQNSRKGMGRELLLRLAEKKGLLSPAGLASEPAALPSGEPEVKAQEKVDAALCKDPRWPLVHSETTCHDKKSWVQKHCLVYSLHLLMYGVQSQDTWFLGSQEMACCTRSAQIRGVVLALCDPVLF